MTEVQSTKQSTASGDKGALREPTESTETTTFHTRELGPRGSRARAPSLPIPSLPVPVSPVRPAVQPMPRGPVSGARSVGEHVVRSRAYAFVLDAKGQPIELGSGRFAKAYLGEERWLESKTAFRRNVAIKILQKGVSEADALRFQLEKELLERVQGHPNIITLYASGESESPGFIP